MTTHVFKPDGRFHSESKNPRGILDNARRRGVERVRVLKLPDDSGRFGVHVSVVFSDGFYAVTNFADADVCKRFCESRWPGKITYVNFQEE